MEHLRLVIAIVLSLAVFLVWDFVSVDRKADPPPGAPPVETPEKEVSEKTPDPGEPAPTRETETLVIPEARVGATFDTITIESSLYSADISEQGAAIRRFDLKEYREEADPGSPRKALIPEDNPFGTAILELSGKDSLARSAFSTDFEGNRLEVKDQPESISFFLRSGEDLAIEKRYTFYPDRYNIDLQVLLRNESDGYIDEDFEIRMVNPEPDPGGRFRFTFAGPFIFKDQSLHEISVSDIADKDTYRGSIQWTGIEDHYFMTALIPPAALDTHVSLSLKRPERLLTVAFHQPVKALSPGETASHDYSLFMGPKKLSLLQDFGHDLDQVVDFGFFSVIAKPALWLMNFIYDNVFANFGVAIILLTLLIKAIFWPLGNKSYKSMAEMRKIQPLMMEIREKYKDDKKKMNEEVMNLYKTYKINPLSGCLPMVVQIPVFIAFYRMLYEAIELRHAPFMLWINDLSAPDRLFHFNFAIPFMAEPTGIPVLTIIMGTTMFLQQKLAPPAGDPMQARIMMMLPLVFMVIFINFPAGLVLYWLVNNLVSIAQQYNVHRKIV